MWLLDQWAERHILDAQTKGEFDNLPGSGEPLTLDDDSHVPAGVAGRLSPSEKCRMSSSGTGATQRSVGSGRLTERRPSGRSASCRT